MVHQLHVSAPCSHSNESVFPPSYRISKYLLMISYEEIMIAHAGATLATRGDTPAKSPFTPSVRTTSLNTRSELGLMLFVSISTCILVFTTSKGRVRVAAIVPAVAPATNDVPKTVLDMPSELLSILHLIFSYMYQYNPEKGTSLSKVGPTPRQSVRIPSTLATF
mmetsp:Transcript_5328/g.12005  ORF Transcript_5328/g.12005 Transcript_5328/m.12005 type:complete len:165 (-) Transcript_5328:795-1289(-)